MHAFTSSTSFPEQRHAADANQSASHRQPGRTSVVCARLMAGVRHLSVARGLRLDAILQ